jgi:hypothetical protein
MSSKKDLNSYEEYIAALRRDQTLLDELDQEMKGISEAEEEILESLNVAEKHLDSGTEEGMERAINQLEMLFSVVDVAELSEK